MTEFLDPVIPLVHFIEHHERTHHYERVELRREPAWSPRRLPTIEHRHLAENEGDGDDLFTGRAFAAYMAKQHVEMWLYAQCWPLRADCSRCYQLAHDRYDIAVTPDGAVWVRNRRALMIV